MRGFTFSKCFDISLLLGWSSCADSKLKSVIVNYYVLKRFHCLFSFFICRELDKSKATRALLSISNVGRGKDKLELFFISLKVQILNKYSSPFLDKRFILLNFIFLLSSYRNWGQKANRCKFKIQWQTVKPCICKLLNCSTCSATCSILYDC